MNIYPVCGSESRLVSYSALRHRSQALILGDLHTPVGIGTCRVLTYAWRARKERVTPVFRPCAVD